QFAASLSTSTQPLPQSSVPRSHRHSPPPQELPGEQRAPHCPQCCGSVLKSVQPYPQSAHSAVGAVDTGGPGLVADGIGSVGSTMAPDPRSPLGEGSTSIADGSS